MLFDVNYTSALIQQNETQAYAVFNDYRLHTAVQPIFSLAHKRIVGYEALVRIKDAGGQFVSPLVLFESDQAQSEIVLLDRLCRHLHLHNFQLLADELNWLFLNVSPHTIANGTAYGSFFLELLDLYHFPPERVVIEVVEYPVDNRDLLLKTVDFYKDLGCLIAIDDFGAGHSNFDRIWGLTPNIVKIDRAMIQNASEKKQVRNLLSGMISLLHQIGALVIIEGIETVDQAMIALESDADFVQGFLFATPTMALSPDLSFTYSFETLFKAYKEKASQQDNITQNFFYRYAALFKAAALGIKGNLNWKAACTDLLKDEHVVRCYLLSPSGIQIDHTKTNLRFMNKSDPRFKPLEAANSADWFRRHYLKRAVIHPEQMQITRPYLSITGAHMCITLSMMVSGSESDRVLCCDLNFDDHMDL